MIIIRRASGTSAGITPVSGGGTGVATLSALSIWVANSADTITSVTPGAGNSIRINAGGTAWEAYTPSGSGNVVGPATATDNAIVVYDGTTGELLKDSAVLISGGTVLPASVQATAGGLFGTSGHNTTSNAEAQLLGSTNTNYQISTGGPTIGALTAGYNVIGSLIRKSTYTEATSGTHALITALAVRAPAITDGTATTTNATTVYVEGAPSGTATPTNVYAMWIDDGVVRIDGSIELGAATDTTITRSAAGVIAVEGVVIPSISSTNTITNKRIQPRTASSTTASTLSPDVSSANVYYRTTQTATLTIDAPTGTPVIGETIMIYVDSASAQTLTINATYKAFGAAFPATTTAGKTFMMSAQYNGTDWKTLWANAV